MKWVLLKKADNIAEALQLQTYLASEGIECSVPNMNGNTFFSYFGSPRVWVLESDLERAKKILSKINIQVVPDIDEVEAPEPIDEKKLIKRAAIALMLSFIIPILANLYSVSNLLLVKQSRFFSYYFLWVLNILLTIAYLFLFIGRSKYEYLIN